MFAIGARSRGTPAPAASAAIAARRSSIPSSVSDDTAQRAGRRRVPRRRQIALAGDDHARPRRGVGEQRAVVVRQRRAIDRARRARRSAAPPAWRAREMPSSSIASPALRAQSRRVDDRERHAADVDALRQQIARRARHVGDDRPRRAGEPVEQARLAGVRPPDDRDGQSFADQPPARRVRQQRVERRAQSRPARRAVSSGVMK